jgi:hypothetical protein
MQSKIFVRRVHVHPDTGHITIRLQSETSHESAAWTGPVKDWGVDAETFHHRFGADKQHLIDYMVGEHKAFMGRHDGLTDELSKLEGTQIG